MKRITVGPFNRVEGDLEVRLDVDGGVVQSAYVSASLYRGFENLLLGRPAFDALVMVPRICGICSVSQSAAAVAALSDLSGAQMPANGRHASNLILAAEVLLDHLTHFYLFFMPDFARTDYAEDPDYAATVARFTAQRGSGSADFLPARARFLTVIGLLAGKWPHTLALRPGGTTRAVSASEIMRLQTLLREMRNFLERFYFGDRLESVVALESGPQLDVWAADRNADWAAFVRLAKRYNLMQVGQSEALLMSSGAYLDPDSGLYFFDAGVRAPGSSDVRPFDPSGMTEDLHAAWYAGGVQAPAQGQTQPLADKADAYSWSKAPRYHGQPAETGALARQWMDGHLLVRHLVQAQGANVMSRVVARGIEVARLTMAMEQWVRAIDPAAPFHAEVKIPDEGTGIGLIEAARGTLGHWLHLSEGRIASYQIVAPTTWNFSPRDAGATPGPLERALVGLPVHPDGKPSALLQHVVRSFDPCLACTVH